MNETSVFETAVTIAPPTSRAPSKTLLEMRLLFVAGGDVTVDVLRHDDSHVAHVADGDGEAGQRHDVGVNAEDEHEDEAEPDGKRQRDDDGHRAAQMQQEDEDDRARHQRFLAERFFERVDGLA